MQRILQPLSRSSRVLMAYCYLRTKDLSELSVVATFFTLVNLMLKSRLRILLIMYRGTSSSLSYPMLRWTWLADWIGTLFLFSWAIPSCTYSSLAFFAINLSLSSLMNDWFAFAFFRRTPTNHSVILYFLAMSLCVNLVIRTSCSISTISLIDSSLYFRAQYRPIGYSGAWSTYSFEC